MALTERERQILRLHIEGLSDYKIAKKLRMEIPNVTRSRKNALQKIDYARADLEFINALITEKIYTECSDSSRYRAIFRPSSVILSNAMPKKYHKIV